MKHMTLLFLLRDNDILLAMKKRGFGVDRWNGVGGKIEPGETIEQAAARECFEKITVKPDALEKVAYLTFTFPDGTTDVLTHVFVAHKWDGEPTETEEMAPRWFSQNNIPYDTMWQDDRLWLPHVLAGKKIVATFAFDEHEQMLPAGTSLAIVEEIA
jgi:mutator protein MutT